jgi:hypothetical protein
MKASVSCSPRCGALGRTDWRKRFPGPTFFITGKVRSELRGSHQSRFWLVDFGLGAAEVNYAAIPADLLERIFVVVRNHAEDRICVRLRRLRLALKVLLS